MKRIWIFFVSFLLTVLSGQSFAQILYPTANPSALYRTSAGEEIDDASDAQSAPLEGHFTSNVQDLGEYSVRYEWRVYREGEENSPILNRFDENLDYTFTESGTFYVQFYATFVHGNDTITYPAEGEANPFVVSISESKLEMPNAFSPNGDGINDVYKITYESIISLDAYIFNRWGQQIYHMDLSNVDEGWDGTYHGKQVKDGVYFIMVKAVGSDGVEYTKRKDINILRGTNGTLSGGNE